ncbi:MAG TPA: hypothetical protein VIA18_00750 [Polyangia bacterium]|nr:hypothetical protein [Polyangia bacterium]HWE28379.1 hypothetical protein [Polyangia bacterium]
MTLPLVLSSLLAATSAQATQCRAVDGGSAALEGIDAETRLAWLDRRLRIDGQHDLLWSALWGSAYGALTVGQLALWPTSNNTSDRAEKIVGASASMIGTLSTVILPPKAIADGRWWARHYPALVGRENPCAILNIAEQLLVRDAADDVFGEGPLVHIGNFIINGAAGLILGLGYNDWKAWGYTTIVGIVVGEIQNSTRPSESLEDLRRYRRGELDEKVVEKVHWALLPTFSHDNISSSFGGQFSLRW